MITGTLCALLAVGVSPTAPEPLRERVQFNDGWRFQKGDPAGLAEDLTYANLKPYLLDPTKAGAPDGGPYAQGGFDDQTWPSVRLPHDWGIEGPFKQEYPGETGKLPWWGTAWYRKHFTVAAKETGQQFFLDLDGAMSYASVWLNGHFVGGRPYGYSSFRVDLTPYVKAGAENVIAIRLDNPEESSRWYPGGGIYRNVWLVTTSPVHVAHWGVYVTTPTVTKESATVQFAVDVDNRSASNAAVELSTQVFALNKAGKRTGEALSATDAKGTVDANGTARLVQKATVNDPQLWSPETPNRYVAITTVRQAGKPVDVVETPFGIRTLKFVAKEGFFLNGKKTFMKGVCQHHDLGAIGSAFNVRAAERQLEILKEMGCNAIRTSHNPPAPELLDLCDRMGFVVMDEFSDTWTHAKKENGYARLFNDWHEIDLRGMIRRDRNHPCVVMWSTGNEISEQEGEAGHAISRMLTAIVHDEDPTRPATSGNDRPNAGFNGYQKTLDVFGFNYKPRLYQRFRETSPDIPLFGSETASTISSRGVYVFPVTDSRDQGHADFQISSYDLSFPGWATTPDMEFKGQDVNPSVFGEFVWTGFDYLGEPTPYNYDTTVLLNYSDPAARARAEKELKELGHIVVPSRSSYFGIIDLAGFPKDRFYLYQARWRPTLKMAHLLPHWNWPERVGEVTPVHLYTSGDEAELFLNGKSLGRKKRAPLEYRLRWDDVKYEPGELKAVVYKNGKPWAQDVVRTTGPAAKLTVKVDRKAISGDGVDLAYLTVTVADANGLMVPRTNNRITFEVSSPGELVATDNGDATDHESFQANNKRAFNGLCLGIVRGVKKGTVKVRVTSPGLEGAELTVQVRR